MERALAAAANASSHASTSALAACSRASPDVIPPASLFAQLLRNSRFAAYDPQIRRTYYSPKQFAQRGYWGLKRPIAQRKKNSFITIKQWEAHQHYVEWDNGEDQVRFIRRMEELGITARHKVDDDLVSESSSNSYRETVWQQSLGAANQTWLVDSEFCPHNWNEGDAKPVETSSENSEDAPAENLVEASQSEDAPAKHASSTTAPPEEILVDSITKNRGEGGYGKFGLTRPSGNATAVIPNVESMTGAQFKRYLAKLRALRPAFKEHIAQQAELQAIAEQVALEEAREQAKKLNPAETQTPRQTLAAVPKPEIQKGDKLFNLARKPVADYHRVFLSQHSQAIYDTTNTIQPQPHRFGGLLYSHPSPLDTQFHTKPKPGMVLQPPSKEKSANRNREPVNSTHYIASFAGVAALLPRSEAAKYNKKALMDEGGVNRDLWTSAATEMRPRELVLHKLPRVVGANAEGLDGTKITLGVTVRPDDDTTSLRNPFPPGSRMYVAADTMDHKQTAAADLGTKTTGVRIDEPKPAIANNLHLNPVTQTRSRVFDFNVYQQASHQRNAQTLDILRTMVNNKAQNPKARTPPDKNDGDGDEGL